LRGPKKALSPINNFMARSSLRTQNPRKAFHFQIPNLREHFQN
jgi:hypothetical protein